MLMAQNREIIQQLFSEVIIRKAGFATKNKGTDFAQPAVSARPNSLNAFYRFFEAIGQAFPDYALNIDNLVVAADRVLVRYTISGTQKGNFLGMAPTHKKLMVTGIDIFRLNKGKIIQHWDATHQINGINQVNPITPTLNGPARVWNPLKASLATPG
jgi:predicted ester cyclase